MRSNSGLKGSLVGVVRRVGLILASLVTQPPPCCVLLLLLVEVAVLVVGSEEMTERAEEEGEERRGKTKASPPPTTRRANNEGRASVHPILMVEHRNQKVSATVSAPRHQDMIWLVRVRLLQDAHVS